VLDLGNAFETRYHLLGPSLWTYGEGETPKCSEGVEIQIYGIL